MKQAFIYSLKVWLTTVLLGMRVAALIKIATDTQHLMYKAEDIFDSAIYDIPVGLIACLPSWLLFSLVVGYLNKVIHSVEQEKLWLSVVAVFLSILPFALLFWHQLTHLNYLPDMLPELAAYTIVTIAGTWFYKLPSITKEVNAVNL